MFTVYASTPESMGPREIVAHAQRAEAMGFDGLQVPDAVHDGFLLAAMALNATVRLKVCIGVLVAFPRSPMNVALAAWDLQAMSDGRFELGLGTQVKGNIEGRYSTPWTSPVPRMREYIGALRAIFDTFQNGSKLDYVSENYRFTRMQPFFNPGPIEHPRIPLLMGACLLYTSDAADGRSRVDIGGRRIINKKTKKNKTTTNQEYRHTNT